MQEQSATVLDVIQRIKRNQQQITQKIKFERLYSIMQHKKFSAVFFAVNLVYFGLFVTFYKMLIVYIKYIITPFTELSSILGSISENQQG
jgi:hypothetical protein